MKFLQRFSNSNKPEGVSSNLRRQLAWLTWPIFIETLLIMMLGAIDTFMLSRVSDESVAAVGVVNQIVMFVFLIFQVINLGTSVLVSQYIGARRQQDMVKVVGVAVAINLVVGLLVSYFLYTYAHTLLGAMGLSDDLLTCGEGYMRIVGVCAFFQALQLTASAVLRACDKAVYPMLVVACVNVFNILGNYVLIFGKFGAPALGVEGAAISTAASRGLAMLALFAILRYTTIRTIPLSLFRKFPGRIVINLLKIGLPSAGEQASYSAAQILVTYYINHMGMEALAARTYVVNIAMFAYLFCIAISQAGAISVGHLVGHGSYRGAYLIGKLVMRRALGVTLTLSIIIAIFGHWIFQVLTDNPEIIALGTGLLIVDIAVEIGRPINIYATNALRGAGDVNYPFYVGLIVMWSVQVFGGYIVSMILSLGIYALWATIALDENIRGFIFVRRWNSMKWAGKSFTLVKNG